MIKVFVVGTAYNYANFIDNCELVKDIESADIVLFTGGEDVTPSIYGCRKHRTTICNKERDTYEMEVFKKIRKDQLAVGICRGLTA